MKYYHKIPVKIIVSFIAALQILVSTGILSFASSDDVIENIENTEIELSTGDLQDNEGTTLNSFPNVVLPELPYTITNPINPELNTVRITFDSTNVIDYSYESEGIAVIENQLLPMSFDLTADDEFGTFELNAQMADGQAVSKVIYTYSDGTSIFTSELSKDNAWHKCKQYEFDNSTLTLDGWHAQYSTLSLSFTTVEEDVDFPELSEIDEAISDGKVVIRGRMTWETKHGTILPLRCARVMLLSKTGSISNELATTYTRPDGYYYFIFSPDIWDMMSSFEYDLFVRVYTESTTFIVLQPQLEQFIYFDSPIAEGVTADSGIINISRRLIKREDSVPYRLFYIHQGMVVGQQFALDMGMESDERLYVFYVNNDTPISELEDFVLDDAALCFDRVSLIGHNKHQNFGTMVHEYGHYVENRMGNYGDAVKGVFANYIPDNFCGKIELLSDFWHYANQVKNDYTHELNINHFESGPNKTFQMQLTWSESWANAFAEIARHKYSSDYSGVYSFLDSIYEPDAFGEGSGEAQEFAVISSLWDIYDSGSNTKADDDEISMTAQEWWNLTTQAGTYTLQDLSENILDNYPELIDGVGKILSNHHISPEISSDISLPCSNADGILRIPCTVNGSSSFPNDKFQVAFYDSELNRIGITEKISVEVISGTSYVAVPKDVWVSVMDQYEGGIIRATVFGYRSGEFDSGPYFSSFVEVWNEDLSHTYDEQGNDDSYHWDECSCGVKNTVITRHSFSYSNTDATSGTHIKRCNNCGYFTQEEHKASSYQSISSTNHKIICVCGYEMGTQQHYNYDYEFSPYNGTSHSLLCICGHLRKTENHTFIMINGRSGCKYCGYMRPVGLIIKDKKEDELINI